MSLQIDHVIIGVPDLVEAAVLLRTEHGLESVPGGQHPGHGTANRIVPLGDSYLELLTVVDAGEADTSPFGRWAMARTKLPMAADGLVLRTTDLDAVCGRLGLQPSAMSRMKPDGTELAWRIAGVERLIRDGLPAFIEWGVPDDELPGHDLAEHTVDVLGVDVVLSGDLQILESWVSGVEGLKLREGAPAISATILTTEGTVTV